MTAALRSSAAVVCFAASQRERLLEQHDLDPDHVHMVPFGVDERFYSPQPLPGDGYVLAVGRDMARDYGTFAEAMRQVDARGVIVASDRNLAGIELPDNVELRLDVSYDELRDLYAGAACIAMPTRREGFSFGADCSGQTVLLDSMAMAKPIIASARSTLRGYVEDAETALVVPPEDPAALAAAVDTALSDRELATRLGLAARRRVDEELSTTHMARRLAPIIRSAASG
jgi:glycosyltransferase involved in cell wall biosynthesis